MSHVFEIAPTGRARCRGCNQLISRGELRFGERLPNAYGEGEMTLWFHPICAAFKRPGPVLEALAAGVLEGPHSREHLERAARGSMAHRRLPRIDGAERAPSSQAKCRYCRERVERGTWRIRLVFYDEGRFSSGGFLHLACRTDYFEGHDIWEAMAHFSHGLDDDEQKELRRAYEATTSARRPSDS